MGDIAPQEGIPKAEKHRLEAEAMQNFVQDMLHGSPAAQKIHDLWQVGDSFLNFLPFAKICMTYIMKGIRAGQYPRSQVRER